MVASALDMAPRARFLLSAFFEPHPVATGLTECLQGRKVLLPREEDVLQPLISAICDGRVDHQDQARLQSSPEPTDAVLALNHLPRGVDDALPVLLALRLLPGCDDGDGNCEELGERTSDGTERQLDDGGRVRLLGVLEVERPDNRIPVEVGKVGRGDTKQGAAHAVVQTSEAFRGGDLGQGVPRGLVVRVVGFRVSLLGVAALYLDLELRLDSVRANRVSN